MKRIPRTRRRAFPLAAPFLFAALIAAPAAAEETDRTAPITECPREEIFPSYGAFLAELDRVTAIEDGEERVDALDALWLRLREANQVPFVAGDSVAFLYRGPARAVEWRGDWNGWGNGGPLGYGAGRRLGASDLWLCEAVFPLRARLDYKIVLNGSEWILDPVNPLRQVGGFGPNSELRMPGFVYPMETVRRPGGPRGRLEGPYTLPSAALGYDVNVLVYSPPGADTLSDMPVVFATDGHEYAADDMGSMVIVLDNLIGDGRIEPLTAVFIDPREVGVPSHNRRGEQYTAREDFLRFVCDELVPWTEGRYAVRRDAAGRCILGTSLGGLNAAYFGAMRPDIFRNLVVMSPAFRDWPEVIDRYRDLDPGGARVFLSDGLLGDIGDAARLAGVLEERRFDFYYVEMNEGHSWGQWRAVLDDAFLYLYGIGGDAASPRE
ncbi:MAG: esterase family protein [Candidatus Eisenbacteria bacterium]|nr:esterase family protein [Candidatus Eisenbacteria bacterium]